MLIDRSYVISKLTTHFHLAYNYLIAVRNAYGNSHYVHEISNYAYEISHSATKLVIMFTKLVIVLVKLVIPQRN